MPEQSPISHLHVTFYTEAVKNEKLSAEEGRPIFDDKEFVKILIAGDKQNVFVGYADDYGPVHDRATGHRLKYSEQFPDHYEAFKRHAAFRDSGSPLEAIGLSPAKVAELNASNIYTVEALAGLDGAFLQKLGMGARELKIKAEAYLQRSHDDAAVNKLQGENDELRARLERMEQLLLAKEPSAPPHVASQEGVISPFQEWDDETIRVWLDEQGAPKPHHNAGHAKLVQAADEWNAKLAADKEAA